DPTPRFRVNRRKDAMNPATICTRFVLGRAALVFAMAVATSSALACVVGAGAGGSCTEGSLGGCLPDGASFDGTVTFACGGARTITVTSTKTISANTTLDGGNLVIISGGGTVGVFSVNSGITFTVHNLTIVNGSNDHGGAIDNSG